MKQQPLFLFLCLILFSCGESEEKENNEDSFFDIFFDDTEEEKENEVPFKNEKEEEKNTIPIVEEKKKTDTIIEKEVVKEKGDELKKDPDNKEVDENSEKEELVIIDYKQFNIRFKAKETFDIHEVEFPDKLKEKGLLKRYKSRQSYFDVYDMQKAIDWSGAGNFAEFGQGFYERSKGVRDGKYCIFAKRRAYSFTTKLSFTEKLNYSNIKKLKSDEDVKGEELVDAAVVFFGKGKYGYRYIFATNDSITKLSSETMEVY